MQEDALNTYNSLVPSPPWFRAPRPGRQIYKSMEYDGCFSKSIRGSESTGVGIHGGQNPRGSESTEKMYGEAPGRNPRVSSEGTGSECTSLILVMDINIMFNAVCLLASARSLHKNHVKDCSHPLARLFSVASVNPKNPYLRNIHTLKSHLCKP